MLKLTRRALMAAVAVTPLMAYAASAEGLISIIVTDPANPYWFTEGEVAKATAEGMGYTANVSAHKGDTNVESTLIDTAITNKSVAKYYRRCCVPKWCANLPQYPQMLPMLDNFHHQYCIQQLRLGLLPQ